MSFDWHRWSYEDWNERLLEYCLGSRGQALPPLERIPATPEELLQVAGDLEANPAEVADAFVAATNECIPMNRLSFCGFCSDYQGWTTDSPTPPHFFAMLWLTCLVSYGYPDNAGPFHDRVARVFGRRQQMDCLTKLWSDVADWANNEGGSVRPRRRLLLPPADDYRSDIGTSWFLAFPHQHDRRKLRDLLVTKDLVGEEPPIAPVVDALLGNQASFSRAFQEDLSHFVEKFVLLGGDARKSAFWRAVRQEALSSEDAECEDTSQGLALLAYFEEDELIVYLACAAGVGLPSGFSASPLSVETDGMSHYVFYEDGVASGKTAMDAATLEVLEGRIRVPRASHYVRRGVLVFQEALGGEYQLVAGARANEASVALVRQDRCEAFVLSYGGDALPSRFHGWYEVVDCEITVRRELPPGLEGVLHLQETMVPPTIRFVGGIPTTEGFLAFPGFLPRVRFEGSTAVQVYDTEGRWAGTARPLDAQNSEWEVPDWLARSAPSEWLVRVQWLGDLGMERTSEDLLVLARAQVRHDYKSLTSGTYDVEACTPSEIEVVAGEEIPLGVTAENFEGQGPDLVGLEPQARYLGPGLGEFSRIAMPGFEWLVVGPKNSPAVLLFTGNPSAPTPPAPWRRGDRGDWRHWRKAIRNPLRNRRAFARLAGGSIVSLGEVPAAERVLREYQRHDPGDAAPLCQVPLHDGVEPPRWSGVVPDPRVSNFIDAVAALSVRRGGIRYATLLDLLSGLSGLEFRPHAPLFFDLIRALVEAGVVDIAHAQGRRASYIIARRPAFVAYRIVDRVRASLIGLTPAFLAEKLRVAFRTRGGRLDEIRPTCKWLPSVVHVECVDPTELHAISADLNLDEPRWLRWPLLGPDGLDLRPDDQALRDGSPHGSFATESRWDWNSARFVSVRSESDLLPQSGVVVERRSHRDRSAVYVVLFDGHPWGWTHVRNWALLHAYSLKDGFAPFEAYTSAPIVRSSNGGVYLPLPLGRLCAVLGDGLAGPLLGPDGCSVEAYQYPIVYTFREHFGHLVPARSDDHTKVI